MADFRPALEFLGPHCDLPARLKAVPWDARVRGIYFNIITQEIERHRLGPAFAALCPIVRRSPIAFYPMSEVLVSLACAGALIASPEKLHDGIRGITATTAGSLSGSLLGRAMIRFLDKNPAKLMEQGLAMQRQTTSHGRWHLQAHGDRSLIMLHEHEFFWIESALVGAGLGTLAACGITATADVSLTDPYNGTITYRW